MKRLQVLFLGALVGVLGCVGLGVLAVAGAVVALVYVVVVAGLLVLGATRARAAQERARRLAGRSCTCCTTSQHDPVRVV